MKVKTTGWMKAGWLMLVVGLLAGRAGGARERYRLRRAVERLAQHQW